MSPEAYALPVDARPMFSAVAFEVSVAAVPGAVRSTPSM